MRACERRNDAAADGFRRLEARILAIGGERVVAMPEPYLAILLGRGREFPAAGARKVRGAQSRCHHNAALTYASHHLSRGGTCEVVTGYALSDDGLWRQHSWLWDGRRVLETTVSRVAYFGVLLNPAEAAGFVLRQVMAIVPGRAEFFRSLEDAEAKRGGA